MNFLILDFFVDWVLPIIIIFAAFAFLIFTLRVFWIRTIISIGLTIYTIVMIYLNRSGWEYTNFIVAGPFILAAAYYYGELLDDETEFITIYFSPSDIYFQDSIVGGGIDILVNAAIWGLIHVILSLISAWMAIILAVILLILNIVVICQYIQEM